MIQENLAQSQKIYDDIVAEGYAKLNPRVAQTTEMRIPGEALPLPKEGYGINLNFLGTKSILQPNGKIIPKDSVLAYADREYLTLNNNWSKMIEGTHEWFCGLGAFLALLSFLSIKKVEMVYIENKKKDSHMIYYDNKYYYPFLGLSMGSQL